MTCSARRSLFTFCLLVLIALFIPRQNTGQTASGSANATSADAPVQVTAEDYARSNQMRPPILREKLKVAFLIPHWRGQHDEFWYRSGTAKIHEFMLANAATGAVHPAFDHQALAQAFAKAAGTEESADALPFEDITFNDDRSSIRVRVQDKDYDCQIKPAVACSAGKPVFPKPAIDISFMSPTARGDAADPNEGVLVSPDTQWGIFTRDNNLWLRNLKSHQDRQLTRDGVRHFGYGTYLGIYEDASLSHVSARLQPGTICLRWRRTGHRIHTL